MKNNKKLPLILSTMLILGSATITAEAGSKEKCYGIAKAGSNDCATKTSSCAGTSKVDNQSDAFIAVPKGLCDKIAGSTKSPT